MSRICILGGGFGGLYTALELSRQPWPEPPQITLVDRQERFVFAPLLYELLTEEMEDWEVAPRFRDLLSSESVQFVQGSVTAIDPKARRVTLQDGQSLEYDGLVLALGGETPLNQVPGAAEYAFPFRTLADAQRLRAHLKRLEERDPAQPIGLAIVGAGASGVELACKLADRLGSRGRIQLIELGADILSGFTESSRKAAQQALAERGIPVELQTKVLCIEALHQNGIPSFCLQVQRLNNPEITTVTTDPVDAVLWTVGTQVAEVISTLDLPKTERGRLQVLPTLQTPTFPEIFALGDVAAGVDAEGQRIPATAQAAFQQASYCAWNLWAFLTQERPLLPFRYFSLGEMLSLGVDTAVLSALGGFTLTGPLGYLARRTAYLVRMPTLEHQLKVGWNWISRPLWKSLLPR
ncbi:NAD(P)/FAD-dependent oxidoreductase [Thermostichus vulcanus]|uniref:NAD(P)/FAD-dependent oxidoreductase n=1 Tax=Thermostichus vulcanus str. 'Rupite' TaxID=2813851 RepID=A0ABT0CAV9_THEVL|nr:NAD(P)/FAD-dependent oxidoreductase [Thermostichus vulcanus]MCJ2542926.1 NAD(P)/FAD-dependent oxidoreductase [Thermostichus vulcanus str. 'Rupite']